MYLSGLVYLMSMEGDILGSPVLFRLPKREKKLSLRYLCGSREGEIARDTTAQTISWTPPRELGAEFPTRTRIPVTLVLSSAGNERQERMELRLPEDAMPKLQVTMEDAEGHEKTVGAYIQNVSRLSLKARAEGACGAKIEKVIMSCGSLTGEGESLVFDLPRSGEIPVTVCALDSRGGRTQWQAGVSVLPYTLPQGGFRSVHDTMLFRTMEYWGSVADVAGKNTGTYALISLKSGREIRYELGEGLYTEGNYSINTQYMGDALLLEAADAFRTVRFPCVPAPLLDVDQKKRALGIGCRGDRTGTVSVKLSVDLKGNPLSGLGQAKKDTDALTLGQGDSRYLYPRLLWENPDPEASFPAGSVDIEGKLFLLEAAPKADSEAAFWELGCPGGTLRAGEGAERTFAYASGKLTFGTTEKGDDWAIPRKIYALL